MRRPPHSAEVFLEQGWVLRGVGITAGELTAPVYLYAVDWAQKWVWMGGVNHPDFHSIYAKSARSRELWEDVRGAAGGYFDIGMQHSQGAMNSEQCRVVEQWENNLATLLAAYCGTTVSGAQLQPFGHFIVLRYTTQEREKLLRPIILAGKKGDGPLDSSNLSALTLKVATIDKARHPDWFEKSPR